MIFRIIIIIAAVSALTTAVHDQQVVLTGETFLVRHGGTGPQAHDHIVLRLAGRWATAPSILRCDVERCTLLQMIAQGFGVSSSDRRALLSIYPVPSSGRSATSLNPFHSRLSGPPTIRARRCAICSTLPERWAGKLLLSRHPELLSVALNRGGMGVSRAGASGQPLNRPSIVRYGRRTARRANADNP